MFNSFRVVCYRETHYLVQSIRVSYDAIFNVSSCVSTVPVVYIFRIFYKMPINVAPRFTQETAKGGVHQFKAHSSFSDSVSSTK